MCGVRGSVLPGGLRLFVCLWSATSFAQTDTGHIYELRARLEPDTHIVEGQGEIIWRNNSHVAQDHLFVHLYLNAFADEETVFMRESNQQLRGVRFRGQGSIEVSRFTLEGQDLLATADDEVEENDHTQLRVTLPTPLEPGQSIRIEMAWTSTLPPVFARSGFHRDFHMVAQWFPKIARLEDNGEWASFPYHGNGEFYADFARYTLSVEVPTGWEVGATGHATDTQTSDGWIRRTFEATNVHDAAFATAPWFEERIDHHTRSDGQRVQVRVLYPPGFQSSVETHLRVTLEGLEHYGRYFGEYPYEDLTVIVPPRGADGAAGMEYPQLFVTAGPWLAVDGLPMALHDEVTAHELGHQWFQGLVASNEVQWPMLDEGLTEWVTGDLLRQRHGRHASGIAVLGLSLDGFELRRAFGLARTTPPPGRPAHAFRRSEYGRSVYARTSTILETVARTWGRPRFYRALGSYARAQRFGHPQPDQLFRAFDAEYGSWISRRILRPALLDGMVGVQRVMTFEPGSERTRVVVQRAGLPLPSHVAVRRGGEVRRFAWPTREARMELDVEGEWDSVEIDPDHHNMTDPERRDDARGGTPASPFARFLSLMQWLLGAIGP